MKRRSIVSATVACVLAAGVISAQEQPARYATVTYYKVAPGKFGAFEAFYKTGEGGKLMRALMKSNPKILAFTLRRPIFAGNPAPPENFVGIMLWEGAPTLPNPATRDELYKGATGLTYAQFNEKVGTLREFVGSHLVHVHDVTPGTQIDEGDIVVSQRYKTAPRKNQAFSAQSREIRLPMATERVKSGGLKSWSFSHLAMAAGSSLRWDSTISLTYKDLASALAPTAGAGGGGGGGGGGAAARFAKLFPNKSYTQYLDDSRENATLVRTDTYAVVVAIRP